MSGIEAKDILLLVLGGAAGVVCNELWRAINPPPEIALLKRMNTMLESRLPPAKSNPFESFQQQFAERMEKYRLDELRGRAVNALAVACGAGTLFIESQAGADTLPVAMLIAGAFASAIAAIYFKHRARKHLPKS